MAQVKIRGQSGGSSKINGIIEEYKVASGGNINAGDFVKFIESKYGEDKNLQQDTTTAFYTLKLKNNKILLITGSYATVCEIHENTVTTGVKVKFSNTSITGSSATLLNENNVIITYKYGDSTAILKLEINGTEITVNTPVLLSSIGIHNLRINGNVIFFSYFNSNNLYGAICNVNETEITLNKRTQLTSNYKYDTTLKMCSLGSNKVLICSNNNSGDILTRIVM